MTALLLWMLACNTAEKNDTNTDTNTNTSTDRDGDGYSNEEEEAAGTNPDYSYSRPYEQGNYNIGYCENGVEDSNGPSQQGSFSDGPGMDISWEHYQQGDLVENIRLQDQYGQEVDLYSFCGNHIMLVVASFT